MGWKEIKEFIDGAGESLRADRERAMLCVAYETLARRGELVALEVRDIDFHPNFDLAAITQAGGWKSTRMPLQHAEKINSARSGMARAAAAVGRDDSGSEE